MAAKRKTRSASGGTEVSGLIITKFPKELRRRIRIQSLRENVRMPEWIIAHLGAAMERVEKRGR